MHEITAHHRPTLGDAHVSASTLRRVYNVAAAVVLIFSGVLVALHLSHEAGGALIASGVQQLVAACKPDEGHSTRHRRERAIPALA